MLDPDIAPYWTIVAEQWHPDDARDARLVEQAWQRYRKKACEQLAALPPVGRATVTPAQRQQWIEGEIVAPEQGHQR